MSNAIILIYCVIVTIETTFICIGNAFAMFVFWKKRVSLRRASYLLLNLAVTDLLLGATELIATATYTIPNGKIKLTGVWPILFSVLFSTVSLLCLLVISLERAFAVLWPFRHRVASTRVYIISIIMVWVAALCIVTVNLLSWYTDKVSTMTSSLLLNCMFFISLCMTSVAYLIIRNRFRSTNPAVSCAFKGHNRKMIEKNIKLSKTLFLVIGLSFGFWLPAITMYTIIPFCDECFSYIFWSIATFLHLGNSLVNPIVYSFRMPMFKAAVRKYIVH